MEKIHVRYYVREKRIENLIFVKDEWYVPAIGTFQSFKKYPSLEPMTEKSLYQVVAIEGEHMLINGEERDEEREWEDVVNIILRPAGLVEREDFGHV